MPETGVAMAAVIPEKKLVRVLVIDDEVDFQNDMTDYFEVYGYAVDVAKNFEEAKALLEQNKYQIALVDVNFNGLFLKGDKFVLKNHADFKGARVVVVTGRNVNELRSRIYLEQLRIPVWDKGDPNWGSNLTDLTEEATTARKEEIADRMNDFISGELGDSGDYVMTCASATGIATAEPAPATFTPEPWEVEIKEILIGWLEGQSKPDGPLFSVGRKVFSARKMIEQVKDQTDVGKELLEMFVNEVKHSLGLGNKLNSRS